MANQELGQTPKVSEKINAKIEVFEGKTQEELLEIIRERHEKRRQEIKAKRLKELNGE